MANDRRIYVRLTKEAVEKLGGEMEMKQGGIELHLPCKDIDPIFAEMLRDEQDFSNSEIEDVFEYIGDISIKKFIAKAIKNS